MNEIGSTRSSPASWVGRLCIDKTSSAELSEAINSMYRWYQLSRRCCVYLSDVDADSKVLESAATAAAFESSRWFTRGWTLQELLAPEVLEFHSKGWSSLGSKDELLEHIHNATGISKQALCFCSNINLFSIAERMSWASTRKTTRIEDEAYSLMGIFDVNMPLLYGEGPKAFIRLQEEIMKNSYDQSLFAWKRPTRDEWHRNGLLSPSVQCFAGSGNIVSMGHWGKAGPFTMTNKGVRMQAFLIPNPYPSLQEHSLFTHFVSLDCWADDGRSTTVAIRLMEVSKGLMTVSADRTRRFVRAAGHTLDSLKREDKSLGEYAEIYVSDHEPYGASRLRYGRRGWTINDGRFFRIADPGRLHWVYPSEHWEPQTRVFHTPQTSGVLGAICIPHGVSNIVVLFGVLQGTEHEGWGRPWVHMQVERTSDFGPLLASYAPTGKESRLCKIRVGRQGSMNRAALHVTSSVGDVPSNSAMYTIDFHFK